jgi:hypothetical protein
MLKSIKTIAFGVIVSAVLATVAHAQTSLTGAGFNGQSFVFKITSDDRKAEVALAVSKYLKDREEYAVNMVALRKTDTGDALERREVAWYYQRQGNDDAHYMSLHMDEVMFNTKRAPEVTLRDVGIARDLRVSAMPGNYWVFTGRTPKDFMAVYGAPAYSVDLGTSFCTSDFGTNVHSFYNSQRTMNTYIDIDKNGRAVEIHVKTCTHLVGPLKGQSIISNIGPVMQRVDFMKRYAANEMLVTYSRK